MMKERDPSDNRNRPLRAATASHLPQEAPTSIARPFDEPGTVSRCLSAFGSAQKSAEFCLQSE